ncbi:hypothetical protein EBZ57_02220 [bacterium]|nr:hypothetical protein [bacterium]
MANRVFLNPDGYIEVVLDGEQTYMTIDNMRYDILDFVKQLQQQEKPVLGLVDLTTDTGYTTDTNKASMQILESVNYDKVAMYGGGVILADISKAIILAMGRSNNTQVFKDRESAVSWLLEKNEKSTATAVEPPK